LLEIILLIGLTRKVGEILRAKGRRPGWFQFLTVVLWIGGELVGAVIGAIIAMTIKADAWVAYPFALLGAILGAVIAYVLARSVSAAPTSFEMPPPPPQFT
jgi:membrane protein DedA with SNARE-associated domain